MDKSIAPGAMLGVLGGGQLGRMFVHAATQMGYRVTVLDPAPTGPAAEIASCHIQAEYTDRAALAKLADTCVAVTTEFENVPAESLRWLSQQVVVSPPAAAVEIAQDRVREKSFFRDNGLPTNRFFAIKNSEDLPAAFAEIGGGAILKTATLGYDGKGQAVCESLADAQAAFARFDSVECILEQRIVLDRELSVVLARDVSGKSMPMPVAENIHRHGILDITLAPARVEDELAQRATRLAIELADAMSYVGVLAVEMFVSDGELLINEIAPRPHNSGHFTIDATDYSQFDQQVRTLCGLPAATVNQHAPAVMLNLLGELMLEPDFDWMPLLDMPCSHLHLYGKSEARGGRKMGHITLVGSDHSSLLTSVQALRARWPKAFA
jgi:5-(carboxyamino)imidazole ribonucleotide synthase